jgi:hypothetical protein
MNTTDESLTIIGLLEENKNKTTSKILTKIKKDTGLDDNFSIDNIRIIFNSVNNLVVKNGRKFDQKLMINSLIAIMKIVDKYKSVKGPGKKKIVLYILKITLIDFFKKDKETIEFLVDNIAPELIDTFINIDKGEIKIKVRNFLKFFKNLICCNKCKKKTVK